MKKYVVTLTQDERETFRALTSKGKHKSQKSLNALIMEMVLDVYSVCLDPRYPVVCMNESPKQLIAETIIPFSASTGQSAKA